MCYRWTVVSALAVANIFVSCQYFGYSLELSRALLTISVTALSITVAIVALYHRDFLAEMDPYITHQGKMARLAGRKVAGDYKNNFGLLLATLLLLSISIAFLLSINFILDTQLFRTIALWAFLSAMGSLATFVVFLTYRLYADARFLEQQLTS